MLRILPKLWHICGKGSDSLLKSTLYAIVELLAHLHSALLQLNNRYALALTDKELHFLVLGVVGMTVYFLVHPLIRWLARHGMEIAISWGYTMTLIIVLAFGIEIGQQVTHTGTMEFADIVFGIAGFLLMFLIYLMVYFLYLGIRLIIRHFRNG